jgi:hypothetical protein
MIKEFRHEFHGLEKNPFERFKLFKQFKRHVGQEATKGTEEKDKRIDY